VKGSDIKVEWWLRNELGSNFVIVWWKRVK
jgi:hypothetical protein